MSARIVGREANLEQLKAMAEMRTFQRTPLALAARGDRLALMRVSWDVEDFEVEHLMVLEEDESGRASAIVILDADELDAAYDELDARYLAGEARPYDAWRLVLAAWDAHTRRDREAFGATATDDFVAVDHRPAAFGRLEGRAEYVEAIFALTDVMPDSRLRVLRVHAIDRDAIAFEIANVGTNPEGGAVELCFHIVWGLSGGRVARAEYFRLDRLEDAMARYAELLTAAEPER